MFRSAAIKLSPLLDSPKLEKLRFDGPIARVAPLRRHPALKFIAHSYNGLYLSAEEFWKDFDAEQAKPAK